MIVSIRFDSILRRLRARFVLHERDPSTSIDRVRRVDASTSRLDRRASRDDDDA
jgi:hypothetical protein|tara:strand:- start:430 stop:591 length:162 start_codon:yes stop_codon:yes gene_type:complete